MRLEPLIIIIIIDEARASDYYYSTFIMPKGYKLSTAFTM